MNKKENFIEKAINKFGDKFEYNNIDYIDSITNIKIKCNIHNEYFLQRPAEHLRGKNGCNLCTRNPKVDTTYFIKKAKETHGDKYDYTKSVYVNASTKVIIICPEHGEFEQFPNNHYKNSCPMCERKSKPKYTYDIFIDKANLKHNNKYDYSLVNYVDSITKVKIICPEHGVFEQIASSHLRGKGCISCGKKNCSLKLKQNIDIFKINSNLEHNNKYDYSLVDYINSHVKVKIICPIHGEFEQRPDGHLQGVGCLKCGLSCDKSENELKDFIKSLNIEFIENTRNIISPLELDIYIPSHNLAIEYDGLYWHSELYKPSNYHLNKTLECEKQGIQLIHIFEDEWLFKQDIVKSRLMNILGLTSNKIFARKTNIKEVSSNDSKLFLNDNHIQGSSIDKFRIGLYLDDELISLMTFGKPRIALGSKSTENGYELFRFCNKLNTSVIGGADKLLKHFIKTYNPKNIISYADRRWSQGDLYEKLGFTFIHNSKPNYYYIINNKRKHRFAYRKDVLIKDGFDPNNTEHDIMLERKIYRIYDCGTITYKLICE